LFFDSKYEDLNHGTIGMKRAVYGRPFYLGAPGQRTHGQVWEKNTTLKDIKLFEAMQLKKKKPERCKNSFRYPVVRNILN
jgi:hypothetical protein